MEVDCLARKIFIWSFRPIPVETTAYNRKSVSIIKDLVGETKRFRSGGGDAAQMLRLIKQRGTRFVVCIEAGKLRAEET